MKKNANIIDIFNDKYRVFNPKHNNINTSKKTIIMSKYQESHPWINFEINLSNANPRFWMLLGEAKSKIEHISKVPLLPQISDNMHKIYIAKGVQATAAIEGNTLSTEDVEKHMTGKLELPKSQEYLKKEIDNILQAFNSFVAEEIVKSPGISPDRISEINRILLKELELADHVSPGEFANVQVGVGNYRGAPPEDLEILIENLCEWLNGDSFNSNDEDLKLPFAILKSILAHLYIAWIHPFGDGNGRTARMVELLILISAGVPTPAAHLLSNHYNATQTEYYRQLDKSSKIEDGYISFIEYALQGFVDGLRNQITVITNQQLAVSWENYIHSLYKGDKATSRRKKKLLLELGKHSDVIPKEKLTTLSPELLRLYSTKTERTVDRDLKDLIQQKLVIKEKKGYKANQELILAFLPPQKFDD